MLNHRSNILDLGEWYEKNWCPYVAELPAFLKPVLVDRLCFYPQPSPLNAVEGHNLKLVWIEEWKGRDDLLTNEGF